MSTDEGKTVFKHQKNPSESLAALAAAPAPEKASDDEQMTILIRHLIRNPRTSATDYTRRAKKDPSSEFARVKDMGRRVARAKWQIGMSSTRKRSIHYPTYTAQAKAYGIEAHTTLELVARGIDLTPEPPPVPAFISRGLAPGPDIIGDLPTDEVIETLISPSEDVLAEIVDNPGKYWATIKDAVFTYMDERNIQQARFTLAEDRSSKDVVGDTFAEVQL